MDRLDPDNITMILNEQKRPSEAKQHRDKSMHHVLSIRPSDGGNESRNMKTSWFLFSFECVVTLFVIDQRLVSAWPDPSGAGLSSPSWPTDAAGRRESARSSPDIREEEFMNYTTLENNSLLHRYII